MIKSAVKAITRRDRTQVATPTFNDVLAPIEVTNAGAITERWAVRFTNATAFEVNVATAHISTGHSAEVGAVVLIEGATPAGLNGEQKVTVMTAGSVQFSTTGIADQTATSAMTLKMASAGWAKAFSDVNLAAYKSTDVVATGCCLYVDDTAPATARSPASRSAPPPAYA